MDLGYINSSSLVVIWANNIYKIWAIWSSSSIPHIMTICLFCIHLHSNWKDHYLVFNKPCIQILKFICNFGKEMRKIREIPWTKTSLKSYYSFQLPFKFTWRVEIWICWCPPLTFLYETMKRNFEAFGFSPNHLKIRINCHFK